MSGDVLAALARRADAVRRVELKTSAMLYGSGLEAVANLERAEGRASDPQMLEALRSLRNEEEAGLEALRLISVEALATLYVEEGADLESARVMAGLSVASYVPDWGVLS